MVGGGGTHTRITPLTDQYNDSTSSELLLYLKVETRHCKYTTVPLLARAQNIATATRKKDMSINIM